MAGSETQAAHFPPVAVVRDNPLINRLYNDIYAGSERSFGFTAGYAGRLDSFRDVVAAGEARSGVFLPTAGNIIADFPNANTHQGPHQALSDAFLEAMKDVARDFESGYVAPGFEGTAADYARARDTAIRIYAISDSLYGRLPQAASEADAATRAAAAVERIAAATRLSPEQLQPFVAAEESLRSGAPSGDPVLDGLRDNGLKLYANPIEPVLNAAVGQIGAILDDTRLFVQQSIATNGTGPASFGEFSRGGLLYGLTGISTLANGYTLFNGSDFEQQQAAIRLTGDVALTSIAGYGATQAYLADASASRVFSLGAQAAERYIVPIQVGVLAFEAANAARVDLQNGNVDRLAQFGSDHFFTLALGAGGSFVPGVGTGVGLLTGGAIDALRSAGAAFANEVNSNPNLATALAYTNQFASTNAADIREAGGSVRDAVLANIEDAGSALRIANLPVNRSTFVWGGVVTTTSPESPNSGGIGPQPDLTTDPTVGAGAMLAQMQAQADMLRSLQSYESGLPTDFTNFDNSGYGYDTSSGYDSWPVDPNTPPIILDLGGHGLNVTQLGDSQTFVNTDASAPGTASRTAWAGAGNGVLVYNADGATSVASMSARDYQFTAWDPTATTDVQALIDVFDTNHDGLRMLERRLKASDTAVKARDDERARDEMETCVRPARAAPHCVIDRAPSLDRTPRRPHHLPRQGDCCGGWLARRVDPARRAL